jgi:hypothetical protein
MEQIHTWQSSDPAVFAIIVIVAFIIHFMPSFIAFSRDHANKIAILIINLLLGWTVIGWVILMVWATRKK